MATIALAAVAVVAGATWAVLAREGAVAPVDQDAPGPVLLVPGYGGSTSALAELGEALEGAGREVTLVPAPGDGTGDLRRHAEALATEADAALAGGAPSVDVVGYSAGGVVVRYWVAELGGDAQARRVVSLASPQHGTELAALAGDLAGEGCPEACQQLAPDSDLLRGLNAGDETPAGPRWIALWTEDDRTVVPPSSGDLAGAVSYSAQSVCTDLAVSHGDVPRTPAVEQMTLLALSQDQPAVPTAEVC